MIDKVITNNDINKFKGIRQGEMFNCALKDVRFNNENMYVTKFNSCSIDNVTIVNWENWDDDLIIKKCELLNPLLIENCAFRLKLESNKKLNIIIKNSTITLNNYLTDYHNEPDDQFINNLTIINSKVRFETHSPNYK